MFLETPIVSIEQDHKRHRQPLGPACVAKELIDVRGRLATGGGNLAGPRCRSGSAIVVLGLLSRLILQLRSGVQHALNSVFDLGQQLTHRDGVRLVAALIRYQPSGLLFASESARPRSRACGHSLRPSSSSATPPGTPWRSERCPMLEPA